MQVRFLVRAAFTDRSDVVDVKTGAVEGAVAQGAPETAPRHEPPDHAFADIPRCTGTPPYCRMTGKARRPAVLALGAPAAGPVPRELPQSPYAATDRT